LKNRNGRKEDTECRRRERRSGKGVSGKYEAGKEFAGKNKRERTSWKMSGKERAGKNRWERS
jgi:hypothetical protein